MGFSWEPVAVRLLLVKTRSMVLLGKAATAAAVKIMFEELEDERM